MTKSELIAQMAQAAGITKAQAERAYGVVVDSVKDAAKVGGDAKLADIGSFRVAARKARTGRNPKTGAQLQIAASKTVAFRPAASLKALANGGK